jgi:hypothetical protein
MVIPVELPFFETVLIVIGVVFIIRGITKKVKVPISSPN